MPKRVPTPPPGDDEPKYMTIWFPYPAHPNLDDKDQRRALAYWVAKIMGGPEDLFAILYRKVSSSMVIIEVNRSYPDFDRLLGAHKWVEFLINPSKEEAIRESRFYWCTYSTGREAEKHGYKRAMIEDTWFKLDGSYGKDYRERNAKIVKDYPRPTWCELPAQEVKAPSLCRPIPMENPVIKPDPPEERRPIVGSEAWFAQQKVNIPKPAEPKVKKPKTTKKAAQKAATIEALHGKSSEMSTPPVTPPTANGQSASNAPVLVWPIMGGPASKEKKEKKEAPVWIAPHPKSGMKGNVVKSAGVHVKVLKKKKGKDKDGKNLQGTNTDAEKGNREKLPVLGSGTASKSNFRVGHNPRVESSSSSSGRLSSTSDSASPGLSPALSPEENSPAGGSPRSPFVNLHDTQGKAPLDWAEDAARAFDSERNNLNTTPDIAPLKLNETEPEENEGDLWAVTAAGVIARDPKLSSKHPSHPAHVAAALEGTLKPSTSITSGITQSTTTSTALASSYSWDAEAAEPPLCPTHGPGCRIQVCLDYGQQQKDLYRAKQGGGDAGAQGSLVTGKGDDEQDMWNADDDDDFTGSAPKNRKGPGKKRRKGGGGGGSRGWDPGRGGGRGGGGMEDPYGVE